MADKNKRALKDRLPFLWRQSQHIIVWSLTSDQHTYSTMGVNPAEFVTDDNYKIVPLGMGRELHQKWRYYWEVDVADIVKKYDAELWSFCVGDANDLNSHDGSQLIGKVRQDQIRASIQIWEPIAEQANLLWFASGTEAHTGDKQYAEEELAANFTNTVWSASGRKARHDLIKVEANGVTADMMHHATTYGWKPWTRRAAPPRHSFEVFSEYWEAGEQPPMLSITAHGHYFGDSGLGFSPRAVYLPGWQLSTTYNNRKGRYYPPQCGGVIVVCFPDGQYELIPKLWRPKRKERWNESSASRKQM